jgi:hypothetical protein
MSGDHEDSAKLIQSMKRILEVRRAGEGLLLRRQKDQSAEKKKKKGDEPAHRSILDSDHDALDSWQRQIGRR